MAEYDDEEGLAVAAAKILLSLRTRNLTRWPAYIPPPSKELDSSAEAELPPPLPEGWPKRPRGPLRVRASGWSPSLERLLARRWQAAPARSGASSSEEETAWSPPRVRVRKAKCESLAARRSSEVFGSVSGSGPSTSGMERARPRVSLKVSSARKEAFMAASSPETPFDYAAAARSAASSSGDVGARSSAKRKAREASRSGAPSSGDEGCSSPAKRTRTTDVQGSAALNAPATAVKVEQVQKIEENNRDEKGHLMFDLNEDISMAW